MGVPRPGALQVDDIAWAPPEWTLCGFPLEAPGAEVVHIGRAVDTLCRLADTVTDSDSTALGPAMHVAHMLVGRQGGDGRWPATLNGRTGEGCDSARTDRPLELYRRLTELLQTTEFEHIVRFAEERGTPERAGEGMQQVCNE